jgi:hypothetical protein
MLNLVFAEAGPSPTLDIGPLPEVRIDGEILRASPGGEILGRHDRHAWRVRGRKFFRVDCACMVKLHFENDGGETSEVYGPFLHFSCADGIAYGDGDICANIDLDSKKWYCHRDEKYWLSMVVRSATVAAA